VNTQEVDSSVSPIHVMLVEDDERLADLTIKYLEENGFEVTWINNGLVAVDKIIQIQPDVVILDLMLPGIDGLEVCKQVRSDYQGSIIMLTARSDEVDQVLGLEIGADDYIAKPVKPRLLLARVRAMVRRRDFIQQQDSNGLEADQAQAVEKLVFDALEIDNQARMVRLQGEEVEMTSAEYDLLWLLAYNAGTILTREYIFEHLRGISYDGQDRSIDVRISRIRPKVGDDPDNPKRIKTVRGKGYLFVREVQF
jgi:two-component system response regulator RstA